jgi:leader peptidase (prepilin peptidase)/N-methyltransferase
MNLFTLIILFIIGSCLGSFLNVCIWRLPKNLSIIRPASFCPKCNKSIKWFDNIPILSFIFLKGKCRYCKGKISFRYPFVEFISGLLIVILYLKFGLSINFIKYLFFFYLLIVASFIDIDYHAIPIYLCFLGIAVGLLFSFFESFPFDIYKDISSLINFLEKDNFFLPTSSFFNSLGGLIFGLGFVYLFKLFGDIFIGIYLSFRKKESIEGEKESLGLGDVDFMGMVGVFLGAKATLFIFFIAPFIALGYSIFAIVFKKSHLIPYLPYLSIATLIWFFFESNILNFFFF